MKIQSISGLVLFQGTKMSQIPVWYLGIVRITEPLPEKQEWLVFNAINNQGEPFSMRQHITKENRDAINYHLENSANGICYVCFPDPVTLTAFCSDDEEVCEYIENICNQSYEEQRKFILEQKL